MKLHRDGRRPVITEDGRVVARISCDAGPAMLGWVTLTVFLS
jgi:antitoxin (DNA-binding transcriptional repressor) of toxin-antitoxin stability system